MTNFNWKFITFNWKFISIMIAVLLLILAIFYVFKNYVQPQMNPEYVANKEYVPAFTFLPPKVTFLKKYFTCSFLYRCVDYFLTNIKHYLLLL